MRKLIFAISALAFAGSAALADVIADREALMKERGGLVGGLSKVVKGETPFDAAAVLTALTALNENAKKPVDELFPEGSVGGKASPKIWEDMAGFKAAWDKYEADTAAAVAAAPQDVEALKASFGMVAANCGSCHETYRLADN